MSWIDFVPVLLTLIAAFVDLKRREIPDSIWIAILVLLPLRIWWLWPDVVLWHLPAGGVVSLLPCCLIAGEDRFGGGDVKLFTALSTWFGVFAVLPLAMWTAIAGMALGIIALVRGKKDYAYGPAILIGLTVHWLVPDLLARIGGWS